MTIEKMKAAIVPSGTSFSFGTAHSAGGTIASEQVPVTAAKGDSRPDTMPEERVQKILRMVESATSFTVRDLALELHLSPSYLQRLFKHQTGLSIGEWLIEQRLQRAAHLLEHSYMSVKEIGHSIGYEHASSFVRAFGRRFAQAPARYRKRCGANC
jgi:AraC-like DNA-binding protein